MTLHVLPVTSAEAHLVFDCLSGFVYTPARVTLGGSPYLLGRVTLLAGLTFYLVNGRSVLCRIAYLGNAQKVLLSLANFQRVTVDGDDNGEMYSKFDHFTSLTGRYQQRNL